MKSELLKLFKTVWHKKYDYGMRIVKTPKDKLIEPKRKIIPREAW